MLLETYQRSLAAALHPAAAPTDKATDLIRDAIRRWARLQLCSLCPLTTGVLRHDGRLDDEVRRALCTGQRPPSIHQWSRDFLRVLEQDPDPVVAEVARFELGCVAPEVVAAAYPDGWRISLDLQDLIADLAAGRNPRSRPARPGRIVLHHDGGGWSLST